MKSKTARCRAVVATAILLVLGLPGPVRAAEQLAATAHALADEFAEHRFSRDEVFAILDQLTSDGVASRYTDYSGGEQAVMALDTLRNALIADGP